MKKENQKVKCPKCGADMNHHADKLIHYSTDGNSKYYDEDLEGYIEQHHKCPVCGTALSINVKEDVQ